MFIISTQVILIYTAAALIPALALMIYIYRLDSVEKEPASLLFKLVLGGFAAVACSFLLEMVLVPKSAAGSSELSMIILEALSVALIEEGTKFFFLKKISWKNSAFNYRFDGIVYAVFVSLGFAALENLMYVFMNGGLSVAVTRALVAIPGHMGFAVYMGIYYGRAKRCENAGSRNDAVWNLTAGYLLAVVFHMLYDATLMIQSELSIAIFVAVVLFIYICIFWRLRKEAAADRIV